MYFVDSVQGMKHVIFYNADFLIQRMINYFACNL